jgi:ankyrin repeat protein
MSDKTLTKPEYALAWKGGEFMTQPFQKLIKKAISVKDHPKLMKLLRSAADVDEAARLAMIEAIEQGEQALAHSLVPLLAPRLVNAPLLQAAHAGMTDLVEKLVEMCDAEDVEPLCEAASAGHLDTVKFLVRHADAREQDSRALVSAARNGHAEVVSWLIFYSEPKSAESEALVQACAHGHTEVVKLLLPVSSKIQCALRGFALAAAGNHQGVIDVLLAAGLPDLEDTYNLGLNEAARAGHLELTGTLLWAVVRTGHKPPRFGGEALVEAASRGHAAVVKVILNFADRTDAFEEALHLALREGHDEVIDHLVRRVDLELTRDLISGEDLDDKLDESLARWNSAKQHRELQAHERSRQREERHGRASPATPLLVRTPRL